jgi:hypothetical protein
MQAEIAHGKNKTTMQNREIAEFFGIKRSHRLKGCQIAAWLLTADQRQARDEDWIAFWIDANALLRKLSFLPLPGTQGTHETWGKFGKGANDFSNLG